MLNVDIPWFKTNIWYRFFHNTAVPNCSLVLEDAYCSVLCCNMLSCVAVLIKHSYDC
jgi:hypothetical protein